MEFVRPSGTYQLDGTLLGSGTYGQVFAATWARPSSAAPTQVALKRFQPSDEGVDATTMREVSHLRTLCHRNIVSCLDVFVDQDAVWLVMPRCECDLIRFSMKFAGRRIPAAQTVRLFGGLVEGVAYMHDRCLLHRDLKPGNLLIGPDRVLKIADLGLSRRVMAADRVLTPDVCTVWYRAPEILFGRRYTDSADMWSVGCILAEMEAGRALFRGDDELQVVKSIVGCLGCTNDESDLAALLDDEAHPFAPLLKTSGACTQKKSQTPFRDFAHADMLAKLLKYNPTTRISARSAAATPQRPKRKRTELE